ncbi:MAG: hypothetical protein E7464_02630 [Ruminococcaceae bacterium]|nr:hypothetical protein [Oscillospiraceae bacterium]
MFMFHNFNESTLEYIKAFVKGDLSIADFMAYFHEISEISDYLEYVIDTITTQQIPIKRRTIYMKNVAQNKPFEVRSNAEKFIKEYAQSFRDLSPKWKENPPRVGNFLRTQTHQTAHGAVTIYGIVADIYYQIDPTFPRTEKYSEEYEFSLDVLPGYLAGGISAENYVSQYILPKYPSTMKKGERKRLVKEEIKLAFQRECKGFPRWIQMPEWPIGSDNKPMIYLGQKAFDHHSEYYFRDSTTNEKYTVTQSW